MVHNGTSTIPHLPHVHWAIHHSHSTRHNNTLTHNMSIIYLLWKLLFLHSRNCKFPHYNLLLLGLIRRQGWPMWAPKWFCTMLEKLIIKFKARIKLFTFLPLVQTHAIYNHFPPKYMSQAIVSSNSSSQFRTCCTQKIS